MSISKTKDLLGQLSKLERTVSEFSFEELSAADAKMLKKSFSTFKSSLENHIYSPNYNPQSNAQQQEKLEIEKKLACQNQFIAHVSHEIRTPLNSIIGFANLLTEEKLSQSQQKKVQAIQFASDSLLKIINEVLDYSKISSGSSYFETIDFKLQDLLNNIMFLGETLIINRNIQLIIEIDPHVPETIKGDPSKLSQVLLNLVGNSIKFVEQGHIKLAVKAKKCNKNRCILEFSVSDTGIGIPKEKLKTIFESYTQAEDNTFVKYGGTGLGLSITKEIIEKQNGEIEIVSELGIGTHITFRLPYDLGDPKNIPEKFSKDIDLIKGKEALAGTEILVFEDNLMNQHLIKEQLTKWGCKVYTPVDSKKGMALLTTKNIDLILMDLKMPNLNGFEISKEIRNHADSRIKTVPIVAFSADFTEQDGEDCKAIGINDFLLKPYTLHELMTIIRKNKRKEKAPIEYTQILQKKMIQSKETTQVELHNLLNDCFGEVDMLNELVRLFKSNVLEFIGNVKIHMNNNNLKQIAFAAHKLKASFAMLKANGMRELIVELEAKCKANKATEVQELYLAFLEDYPLLEQNMDRQLAELNKNS
ncbi:ATP-binding protein [Maribacter sp. X9]|uniref:ATP-binding protein n=1 Tax=Maribacter sp. X9 TaxID=3402159 RepID=UPI003AF3C8E5